LELASWHLSVLVLLAVATTVILMVAIAWDSRDRHDSPWT
jgi:hypothetical protein